MITYFFDTDAVTNDYFAGQRVLPNFTEGAMDNVAQAVGMAKLALFRDPNFERIWEEEVNRQYNAADAAILVADKTRNLFKQRNSFTRIVDLHYINKLKNHLKTLEKADPVEMFADFVEDNVRKWNIDSIYYNMYLRHINTFDDEIVVDGISTTIGDYFTKTRVNYMKDLLESNNPMEQMLGHGLIFNNIIAYRNRITEMRKLDNSRQVFRSSSIYHDLDYTASGQSGSLDRLFDGRADM